MKRRNQFLWCVDCGTDKVLPINLKYSEVSEILCKDCLTTRALLQSLKEDKLSFSKLLEKIRKETERRVASEIKSQNPAYTRLSWYKGISGTVNANYWKEQLQQSK